MGIEHLLSGYCWLDWLLLNFKKKKTNKWSFIISFPKIFLFQKLHLNFLVIPFLYRVTKVSDRTSLFFLFVFIFLELMMCVIKAFYLWTLWPRKNLWKRQEGSDPFSRHLGRNFNSLKLDFLYGGKNCFATALIFHFYALQRKRFFYKLNLEAI